MHMRMSLLLLGTAVTLCIPASVSAQAWTAYVPGKARRQYVEGQIGTAPSSCSTGLGRAEKYSGVAGASELWIIYDSDDVVSFVQAEPSGSFTDADAKRNWGTMTVGLPAEGAHHRTHYPQGRAVVAYNASGYASRIVLGASLEEKKEKSGGLGAALGSLLTDALGLNTAAAIGAITCY